eukprot:scaffold22588_cov114-Cylindrotheca_fusiformis.AAC.7
MNNMGMGGRDQFGRPPSPQLKYHETQKLYLFSRIRVASRMQGGRLRYNDTAISYFSARTLCHITNNSTTKTCLK